MIQLLKWNGFSIPQFLYIYFYVVASSTQLYKSCKQPPCSNVCHSHTMNSHYTSRCRPPYTSTTSTLPLTIERRPRDESLGSAKISIHRGGRIPPNGTKINEKTKYYNLILNKKMYANKAYFFAVAIARSFRVPFVGNAKNIIVLHNERWKWTERCAYVCMLILSDVERCDGNVSGTWTLSPAWPKKEMKTVKYSITVESR